jgi:GMP synthase (glutamine-hydrolysing)
VIGIVLSGRPELGLSPSAPIPDRRIFEIGVPVLGICYGLQLMGHLLGGKVAKGERREYGHGILRS